MTLAERGGGGALEGSQQERVEFPLGVLEAARWRTDWKVGCVPVRVRAALGGGEAT